jgi:deoxyribodipyrimidine photo-lyase
VKKYKRSLVWFRNNFRIADNEALTKAIEQSEELVFIAFLPDRNKKDSSSEMLRTAMHRYRFYHESIAELQLRLKEKEAGLLVSECSPVEVIPELAKRNQLSAVFTQELHSFEERKEEDKLRNSIATLGCDLLVGDEDTLIRKADLPFPQQQMPAVFTAFRTKVERRLIIRQPLPEPDYIPSLALSQLQWDETKVTALLPEPQPSGKFIGGERQGLKRLHHYFWETDGISRYKETRNGLLGMDYSSKFSLWLANGSISARTIYAELIRYEQKRTKNESTYWMFFELLWRDFFKFHEQLNPLTYYRNWNYDVKKQLGSYQRTKLEEWMHGETGKDFVDANMIELNETGFMSNRGRQNVASFLVNDLKLPWQIGATWFEQQLIDYDPASNWGNWSYLAGTGNDPRSNRYFNIDKQQQMYDPERKFTDYWLKHGKNVY